MIVTNPSEYSPVFRKSIVVRQGGVLSPKLYSIYIEGLIQAVEQTKARIKLGRLKVDILHYADDIVVTSQNKKGGQKQLNLIAKFGLENDIKYNPDKTAFMVFHNTISSEAIER
jgi:hypothetical protein